MENLAMRENRTLALAGVVQAACLVKQLAWKGTINQKAFDTSIYSIFQTHAPTVSAVYGERSNLITGLQTLSTLLHNQGHKDPEIARYTISLLHLERLLTKNQSMLTTVQRGIERAKAQAQHFSNTHENVIANIAGLYIDTLSTFKFRIHVSGESSYLSNNHTVNKIRAILLAGVRSAVLWRQLGGSRWQLVLGKRSLLQDIHRLLEVLQNIEQTV